MKPSHPIQPRLTCTPRCEICNLPRGKNFDHTICSQIKQKQHANDKRRTPATSTLPRANQRAILELVERSERLKRYEDN